MTFGTAACNEEIRELQEQVDHLSAKIGDPAFCEKVRAFVGAPAEVQQLFKRDAEQEGIDLLQTRAGHGAARGQVADVVANGGVQTKDGARGNLAHSPHIGWRIEAGQTRRRWVTVKGCMRPFWTGSTAGPERSGVLRGNVIRPNGKASAGNNRRFWPAVR